MVIDINTLTADEGVIIQGDMNADQAGYSVSNAGDVNGDGIDDVIIGARGGDDGGNSAGEAYIVYGRTDLSNLDLDLGMLTPEQGIIIQGNVVGGQAGAAVSTAGDLNGDGFDDVIVGAPSVDMPPLDDATFDQGLDAGEAYIIFGGSDLSNIDIGTLTAEQGITIQGQPGNFIFFGDLAGAAVSNAGDVNGDGINDAIIGALGGDNGGSSAGEAYIIFGSSNLSNIDLQTITPSQGIIIQGDEGFDQAGSSVSNAGDVNGDGIDDVIIGARVGDDGGTSAGEAYIIYGGTNLSNIDLSTLTSTQGIIIQGDTDFDQAGRSVSAAGDVNGDGIDDVIIGAPFSDTAAGDNVGEAYIVFGGTNLSNIDLTMLTLEKGIIIEGDDDLDNAGQSVSNAGDVNGDGFDDVIIGAPEANSGVSNSGEAYIVFGSSNLSNINLGNLTAEQGFIIQGNTRDDNAGFSVSAAGDVNGDGGDDIIIGAPSDGNPFFGATAGSAVIIFGATPVVNQTLIGLAGDDTLSGDTGNDTISGLAGNDVLNGGAGNDVLDGGAQNDILEGGSGNDILLGGLGRDFLFGGVGDDLILGGNRDDELHGQGGNDRVFGGNGNDEVFGGDGNDILRGGTLDDLLDGGSGDDAIFGGTGIDTLLGGDGNDKIDGRGGFDTLNGGAGDDVLTGGFNADTFVFDEGFGFDIIMDFAATSNAERIDLSAVSEFTDFADLTANHLTQSRTNVIIDDGAGNIIVLLEVNLSDLDAIDFIF